MSAAITRKEASIRSGVCLATIDRHIREGKLKAFRPSPRRVVIPESAFEEWIANGFGEGVGSEIHKVEEVSCDSKGFGSRMRYARIKAGLTQLELGELIGVTEPAIRALEIGTKDHRIKTVEKIAKELNVSPAWLCGWI